ncbi:hypothetical protein BGX27_009206 [Mortierella sp. AM989]|nr:hypothetical protein BGX27_009206 [Mortierella sp. AM989]
MKPKHRTRIPFTPSTATTSKCPIHVYEIACNIADMLSKKDLGACILVSKDWSHWFVPFIWHSITAKATPISTAILKQSFRHHGHHIRSLSIQDCSSNRQYSKITADILEPISNNLKTFVFDKPWIAFLTRLQIVSTSPFEQQVLNVIHRNSATLRELKYEFKQLEWLRGQDLPVMPMLQILELGNCKLTKDRLRKMILAKCPKLQTLGLRDIKVLSKDTVVPARGRPELDVFARWQSQNITWDGDGRPRPAGNPQLIRAIATGLRPQPRKQQQQEQQQRKPLKEKRARQKGNPPLLAKAPTNKDENYIGSVTRYIADNKVYPVLDLFPNLESIVFRPNQPSALLRHRPTTSECYEIEQMIKSSCHNLHSLAVETYPPHRDLWQYLLRAITRLTRLDLGNHFACDRSFIDMTLQRHYSVLESVHVNTVKINPNVILQVLEKCPRLRKWSCSATVSISAHDLENSLLGTNRKSSWVCVKSIEEISWPESIAGFSKQDIDKFVVGLRNHFSMARVLQSQLEQLSIKTSRVTVTPLVGGKEEGINTVELMRGPGGELRYRVFMLLLKTMQSMDCLKAVSFGDQWYTI